MAQVHDEDEGDDSDEDAEAPDPSDTDDDEDGPDVVPCPYCGKEVSEVAEVCPHCRSFLSFDDAPRQRSRWLIVVAVVLLAAMGLGMVLTWF